MLRKKLAGVLEIYEKFVGEDPYTNPMRVFPAVHYTMGGLWVDFERARRAASSSGSPRNQATNIPGLYAVGEVDYQYHGANRLGANSLLSCIYGGMVAGPAHRGVPEEPRQERVGPAVVASSTAPRSARRRSSRRSSRWTARRTRTQLHEELAQTMLVDCTIERHNPTLDSVLAKVEEIAERAQAHRRDRHVDRAR